MSVTENPRTLIHFPLQRQSGEICLQSYLTPILPFHSPGCGQIFLLMRKKSLTILLGIR